MMLPSKTYLTLAKKLQNDYELDPERTFITEISNDGFMSYTLICLCSNVFKGCAAVTALIDNNILKSFSSEPRNPILHIHGSKNVLVQIRGIFEKGMKNLATPTALEVVEYCTDLNKYSNRYCYIHQHNNYLQE